MFNDHERAPTWLHFYFPSQQGAEEKVLEVFLFKVDIRGGSILLSQNKREKKKEHVS